MDETEEQLQAQIKIFQCKIIIIGKETVFISEIDSLLISESEILDALNKGFEEIKNYNLSMSQQK